MSDSNAQKRQTVKGSEFGFMFARVPKIPEQVALLGSVTEE